jgi:hypothetical protein
MSKLKLRTLALLSFVAGVFIYPFSIKYLFPLAQSASGLRDIDGRALIASPTAGTWIFVTGFIAAIILLAVSCFLLWRSFKRSGEA